MISKSIGSITNQQDERTGSSVATYLALPDANKTPKVGSNPGDTCRNGHSEQNCSDGSVAHRIVKRPAGSMVQSLPLPPQWQHYDDETPSVSVALFTEKTTGKGSLVQGTYNLRVQEVSPPPPKKGSGRAAVVNLSRSRTQL